MSKKYFYNLDGLRFIAAMTVAFSHLETVKSYLPLSFIKNRFVEHSAQISVTFFFVLSGFLIMWWFLEDTAGDIQKLNIKRFYVNRISRTWPLYYFVIFFSFLICLIDGRISSDPLSMKRFILYVLWMPNLVDLWYKPDIYLGQTWSLAVEEFFYLLFPLFLLKVRTKSLFKSMLCVLAIFLVLATLLNPIFIKLFYPGLYINSFLQYLIIFLERYRIYAFLAGALTAVVLFNKNLDVLNICIKKVKAVLLLTCLIVALIFIFGLTFSFITHQVYSLLFALMFMLFSYSGYNSYFLNKKLFFLGGKISYGIYMLHMFVVMRLVNQGAFLIQLDNNLASIFISWFLLFCLTFILSYFSYRFFENPLRIWIRNSYLKKGEK